MSIILSVILAVGSGLSASVQASQLPAECNVYGHLFCLPVTAEVRLHTFSPMEDFVLHEIISDQYKMLIYEGNAPQTPKVEGIDWKKIEVDGREYSLMLYNKKGHFSIYIGSSTDKWPTDIHINCSDLKSDGCKNQLLLMKSCSRNKDDVTCTDDYSKIFRKKVWATGP